MMNWCGVRRWSEFASPRFERGEGGEREGCEGEGGEGGDVTMTT